jgi:hypothetical protein
MDPDKFSFLEGCDEENFSAMESLFAGLALLEILENLKNRLRAIANEQKPVVSSSLRNCVQITETRWQGSTDLCFSNWSRNFLHGADTLLPVGTMLEQMMDKNERLEQIEDIRWKEAMKNNLRLTGSTQTFSPEELRQAAMLFSCRTSANRKLYVKGEDDAAKPVSGFRPCNRLANVIFSASNSQPVMRSDGASSFKLEAPASISTDSQNPIQSLGFHMSTAVDLINYACMFAPDMQQYDKHGLKLFLGVKDFSLPELADLSEIRFHVQHGKVRQSQKAYNIIPSEIDFRNTHKRSAGGCTAYFAYPATEEARQQFLDPLK